MPDGAGRAVRRRGMTRKRPDLVHVPGISARPPILPGWAIASDDHLLRKPEIVLVREGPEYTHLNGHALGEIWTLHDGSRRPGAELTPLDLADVLEQAVGLLRDVRLCRRFQDADILRVHRASCLAQSSPRAGMTDHEEAALDALVALDWAIAEVEAARAECFRSRLPNLVKSLHWAGVLALAGSEPAWVPGDPYHPHPRWRSR